MWTRVLCGVPAAVAFVTLILVNTSVGENENEWKPSGKRPAAESSQPVPGSPSVSIEAVVVHPYRSANVGTQVSGVIERFHFDEGDLIQEGQIVAELDQRRYQLQAQRAQERLKAFQVALKRAQEEAQVKSEVFALDATTREDVLKAKAEAEMAQYRVGEAQKELELALFDLQACKVKAPFTGHLTVRYKQPDETVDRLEKIYSIVDSSKVHAVANVPETALSHLGKGSEAYFVYHADKKFKGTIDRIGKLIDPKSRTKRVYLLIDNSGTELEVGMTGTLKLGKSSMP
jgi:RND family efflux transporter MFP subunit